MFKVDKSWNVPMPKIFGDDNCEVYECVEIQLNIYIFILEFTVDVADGCEVGRRIMFNNIYDILKVAAHVADYNISLFAPRYSNQDGEMSISTVNEVIKGEEEDQPVYIYKCKNGITYVDSHFPGQTESQIKDKEIIYSKCD